MTCGILLCEWGENELHSCVPGDTGGSGISWVKSSERRYASVEGRLLLGAGLGFLRHRGDNGDGNVSPMMVVKESGLGTAYGGHQGLWGVPSSGCLTKMLGSL